MKMEKKFRDALLKVVENGVFKNISALCAAADVDQAGVSAFIKTTKFYAGLSQQKPGRPKQNMNLEVVSKLVDAMQGELVFPWDSSENQTIMPEYVRRQLAEKDEIIKKLTIEKELLQNILTNMGKSNAHPDEIRKNKSCA